MSRENVEIVRLAWEEFEAGMARGDPGAAFDTGVIAADAEWISPQFEGRTAWVGREGFVEFIRTWSGAFEGWSIRVERVIDAGDDVVVVLTQQSGKGKASGVPVTLDDGHVWELEDGRVVRMTVYMNQAAALEAAGLQE